MLLIQIMITQEFSHERTCLKKQQHEQKPKSCMCFFKSFSLAQSCTLQALEKEYTSASKGKLRRRIRKIIQESSS